MNRISKNALYLILLLAAGGLSCARDYVTGKRTFSLVGEDQEIAMGRQADPSIVAEYGLYEDKALADFISSIGAATAKVSHRSNLQYTFRVVDSPIVNAFALPGGWVYFTRGILAHFNSEDELAGVMGHEVGHVVARHGAEQMSKAQLAQIGLGVGSILSQEFAALSNLASTGLGLLFLSYGRAQESESDKLGAQYATALGYDARKMAAFFRTIARLSGEGGRLPSFLSTHPDPGQREERVKQLANEYQSSMPYTPKKTSRADYLRRIEGIIYGNDPRQGFVDDNVFYHPVLKFQFPVPPGWKLQNSPSVVQMTDEKQGAGVQFRLGEGASLQQAANAFVTNSKATVQRSQNRSVNGLPALELVSALATQDGTLGILSYFIQMDKYIYVFHGFTSEANFGSYVTTFAQIMTGFDRLRNRAALNVQPDRIRIKTAPRRGTVSVNLKALGVKDDKLAELALINGMELTDTIDRGELLKVVAK